MCWLRAWLGSRVFGEALCEGEGYVNGWDRNGRRSRKIRREKISLMRFPPFVPLPLHLFPHILLSHFLPHILYPLHQSPLRLRLPFPFPFPFFRFPLFAIIIHPLLLFYACSRTIPNLCQCSQTLPERVQR